jgi:hypothetical protein
VFLTHRRAKPSVALVDDDQRTGRARLSYRRAADLFETHTEDLAGGPFTLHQLRHSGLTHAAEQGASTPMLMALSGHTSVRSLAKRCRYLPVCGADVGSSPGRMRKCYRHLTGYGTLPCCDWPALAVV